MSDEAARVVVLDDEPAILENLDRLLSSEGYECSTLSDPRLFRELRAELQPDLLITDIHMPEVDGLTVLATARADDPTLPVILITGFASVSSAVEAMREGAFDYLAKPFSADQLFIAVERAIRYRTLVLENRELRRKIKKGAEDQEVLGGSPSFERVLSQLEKVARTEANVLITGESGTGKEVMARLLHDRSRRSERPFMPVDCAALPEGLLESELFGHTRGAFTGAVARRKGLLVEANGGTVFLDEVGELSIPLQSKVLRTLEERQVRPLGDERLVDVDIRIVAATNIDLLGAVREGTFREDLYYRLNVVNLDLPPLRSRVEDIPILAGHFLKEFSRADGRDVPRMSPEVWRALDEYPWPGNIRELRNVIQRLVALNDDGMISLSDTPEELRFPTPRPRIYPPGFNNGSMDYAEARAQAHQAFLAGYLERLLEAHGGNITQAAKTAGVSRRTIHRWLAELEDLQHG